MPEGLLESLLGRPVAGVLAALLARPEAALYQREIARACGLRGQQVQRALATLEHLGVVLAEPRGNRVYYRVNSRCPVYPELRGLVLKTAGLVDVLREALSALRGVKAAFVYGSLARGDDDAASDVDLLVVGDVAFAELAECLHPAQETLAREVNPTLYSVEELCEKVAAKHHFLIRVLEEPKLFVIGDADVLGRLAGARVADRAPKHA